MTCDYLTARSQTRERHLALAPGHPGTGQTAAAGPSPAGPPAAGPTSRAAAAGPSPAGPSPAGLTSRRLPGWLGLALICCGAATLPWLKPFDIMNLHSATSAILSAVIFNAIIIPLLIPIALKGVAYRPVGADALLRRNLLVWGLGGVIVPFVGIKLIDVLIVGLHLTT